MRMSGGVRCGLRRKQGCQIRRLLGQYRKKWLETMKSADKRTVNYELFRCTRIQRRQNIDKDFITFHGTITKEKKKYNH